MWFTKVSKQSVNHMQYVGADVDITNVVCSVMTNAGRVKETFVVLSTPAGMDELIEKMGDKRKWKVLFESSTYSTDLHIHLMGLGVQTYTANAYSLKVINASRKKTDKNDSIALARYLRLWDRDEIELSISHIVTGDEQKLRDLCKLREELAQEKAKTAQRIKAHMRRNGEYLDETLYPDLKADKALNHILETFTDDFVLCERVRHYVYLTVRCKDIDKKLENSMVMNDEVRLLDSIPGIGMLSAVQLMSAIVDISRFPTQGQFRSYFGLAPKVKDSGGKMHHGHITKMGDKMVRHILYRVIYTHMNACPNGHIKRYYDACFARMGKSKARTAASNKLLDLIYAILRRGTPFITR